MPKRENVGRAFVGIDPGASGGIVRLDGDLVSAWPMPETWREIDNTLSIALATPRRLVVGLELVGGFMSNSHGGEGSGKRNMASAHTMFAFGKNVGFLLGVVVARVGLEPESVVPAVWQRSHGIEPRRCRKDGRKTVWLETPTQFKARMRVLAQSLLPDAGLTSKTADAALIALYLKRKAETP